MGFTRDAAVNALQSANQNEDIAISMLLSSGPPQQTDAGGGAAAAQPPAQAPASSSSSSGLFGKLWGKK